MNRVRRLLLLLCCLPTLAIGETYVAIVQGLAGESFYQRQFDEQRESLLRAATSITDADKSAVFAGEQATKAAVTYWFTEVANKATSGDSIALFLVGHGSYNSRDYKFNIPGPDLTGQDILALFESNAATTRLLVSSSSSSGALLETFKDKDIILATATKNAREKNATRFGRFFAMAMEAEAADLDKNKAISIAEAFAWAERETADFYSAEGLLATEHPQLVGENTDRVLVSRWQKRPAAATNPVLANLYQQRDDVDREIERLRIRRIGMTDDDYLLAFQQLMLDLGDVQDLIDIETGATE